MFVPNGCQNSSHKLPSVDPFPFPSYMILSSQGVTLTNCTSVNLLVAPASSIPHSSFLSCLKDKALQSSQQDRAASCSYWHAHLAESARIIVPPCWDEHFATGQYKARLNLPWWCWGFHAVPSLLLVLSLVSELILLVAEGTHRMQVTATWG